MLTCWSTSSDSKFFVVFVFVGEVACQVFSLNEKADLPFCLLEFRTRGADGLSTCVTAAANQVRRDAAMPPQADAEDKAISRLSSTYLVRL